MKRCISPCLLWLCLCVFTASVSGDSQCLAEFKFPPADIQLQGVEPMKTSVRFRIVNKCSGSLDDYHIKINAFDGRIEDPGLGGKSLCSLTPSGVRHGNCDCDAGLSCNATDTFPRQPHRTWRLSDLHRRIEKKIVVFNVTYPTFLEHFHFTHHEDQSPLTVNKGVGIQFDCQWSEGNPQRRVLLLGPDNNTLEEVNVGSGRHNVTRHTIKNVACSDGGQYRCQVEGTEEVKSLTVLVRCPLTFKKPAVTPTIRVTSGEDATFSFRATSYTHDVSSCQLKKPDDTAIGCNSTSSDVIVAGPLPDVNVIVTLRDVAEGKDEGMWRLTVANPTPASSEEIVSTARFNVSVINHQPGSQSLPLWTAVTIGAGVLVCVIVIAVAIYWYRRKRKAARRRCTPRQQQQQQQQQSHDDDDCQMIINDLYGTSGNCQMITNTLYAGAETVRMAGPDCSAPYEDVDRAGGTNPPPRPCRSSEGGGIYVDVEEIRRNKARDKGKAEKDEDKQAEGGAMYVDAEEIRRNKARDKGKAKKEGGAMYVDAEEIRRNKARDKGKAKKVSGPKADD